MRIAINTRFLLPNKMEGFGWYTYEIVKRIVESHPEHDFIFFFDRKYDPKFIFGENVTPIVLHPQARHPILFKIWFNFSVTRALKKYNADLFFSPDGYLSLKTNIPQIGVIHDINFEHHPDDLPKNVYNYLSRYFKLFAKKANHIITVSNYSKQDIIDTYKISGDKISAIWNGVSDLYQPVDDSTKKMIQQKYANGKPYLLFVGALHPRKNLKRLIAAYNKFLLENPDSDLQLVIVGESIWGYLDKNNLLSNDLKNRIHLVGHVSQKTLVDIMGSAFIFTFIPYFEGFGIPLVEAMKAGTPVLCGNKTALPEVGGDAVHYCDPFNVDDIQHQLTKLVKDKELRDTLIAKGLHRAKKFNWDTAAKQVWDVIVSTYNEKVHEK